MESRFWGQVEDWLEDDIASLRYEFGLDADTAPREWKRDPRAWETARRVDRLADALVRFVKDEYRTPLDEPSEIATLRRTTIPRPVQDKLARMRDAFLRAEGEPGLDLSDAWTVESVPVLDLLSSLCLRKLGPQGMKWEATGGISRLAEIASLPVPEPGLPESVLRYRFEALDAYAHGSLAMCTVWCRSAVERGVKDALQARNICRDGSPTMGDCIRLAVLHGALDQGLAPAAKKVYLRGSKAVHEDPALVGDTLETVRAAMIILEDLRRRWPT
ncbi:MAG: hypothetical protein ACR2KQ_03540 [Actinomycetota bacterium]